MARILIRNDRTEIRDGDFLTNGDDVFLAYDDGVEILLISLSDASVLAVTNKTDGVDGEFCFETMGTLMKEFGLKKLTEPFTIIPE